MIVVRLIVFGELFAEQSRKKFTVRDSLHFSDNGTFGSSIDFVVSCLRHRGQTDKSNKAKLSCKHDPRKVVAIYIGCATYRKGTI